MLLLKRRLPLCLALSIATSLLVADSISALSSSSTAGKTGQARSSLSPSSSTININHLLSTCADACRRGCHEIRLVQLAREANGGVLHSVTLKESHDPKSALTEADCRSQAAIIHSLRQTWGPLLTIVGEEDDDDMDIPHTLLSQSSFDPLDKGLCSSLQRPTGDDFVPIDSIVVFCDPLDGTREFVQSRLHNCQTLVGIAVNGEPIAGAIGIPFPTGDTSAEPTIVVGRVGSGCLELGTPLSPSGSNGQYKNIPRPHLATGDTTFPLMNEARSVITSTFGATNVIYGGAGNKILSTALGHADCTLQHMYGGPWDTCAPAAILKAMGGKITDMYGDDLVVHRKDAPSYAPKLGYAATGHDSAIPHHELIECLNLIDEIRDYRSGLTP